jgi:hypothetical protein
MLAKNLTVFLNVQLGCKNVRFHACIYASGIQALEKKILIFGADPKI